VYLNYLKIFKGSEVIRNIAFRKGANFIIDNTPFTKGTESGNNVGKTTILRLVDFCFGSDGKDIYSDTEFRDSRNTELKTYLEDNNFIIELSIVDTNGENEHVIRRNFLARNKKLISINGEVVSKDNFRQILNEVLFNNKNNKPSLRYLISKFIRNTPHKMSNTLRYLHNSTTDATYESVHLYLFGISLSSELIEEKSWLESKLKSEREVFKRITEDGNSESALKQALSIINNDIKRLESEKENFNISQNEEKDIDELNRLKFNIAKLSASLGRNETKLRLINDTLAELSEGKNSYDVNVIKDIYSEAKLYIPNLQKRFEDVVGFHNSMIDNKIKFLSKDIPEIKHNIATIKLELFSYLQREKQLSLNLNRLFKIKDYDDLIKELNEKYELKGNKEERYSQVIDLNQSIDEKSERLDTINDTLEDLEPRLEKNMEAFNLYFSKFSKALYNEEFYASYDKVNGNYKFNVRNIQANVGGGKKKGQIAAFDLAYTKFCNENKIISPKFVMHDSTEDVSINQLMIINELANAIDGQYIVAVLRDKFSGDIEQNAIIEENKIIELSQDDKLFKF
tara:strand:- start:284287 stop:285993 length:1707 start_codon:yes stop_codon:yes gene_type:complete